MPSLYLGCTLWRTIITGRDRYPVCTRSVKNSPFTGRSTRWLIEFPHLRPLCIPGCLFDLALPSTLVPNSSPSRPHLALDSLCSRELLVPSFLPPSLLPQSPSCPAAAPRPLHPLEMNALKLQKCVCLRSHSSLNFQWHKLTMCDSSSSIGAFRSWTRARFSLFRMHSLSWTWTIVATSMKLP